MVSRPGHDSGNDGVNVMAANVMSFDVMAFDVMAFDVMSFDVMAFDVMVVRGASVIINQKSCHAFVTLVLRLLL